MYYYSCVSLSLLTTPNHIACLLHMLQLYSCNVSYTLTLKFYSVALNLSKFNFLIVLQISNDFYVFYRVKCAWRCVGFYKCVDELEKQNTFISCRSFTVLCHSLVCDFNDTQWDVDVMQWDLYAMLWDIDTDDWLIWYTMLCDLNKNAPYLE